MTSIRGFLSILSAMVLVQTAFVLTSEASRWRSNYFPNVPLVTHDGRTVRFYDDLIKDKVVAINFIYTTCEYSCPLETAQMRQVQKLLGDRVGNDVFFYSISIDPQNDTPAILANYVNRFQVGPGWQFLTGDEADITLLRKKLGLYIEEIQDGSNDHNLSLIIGNERTGNWMKRSPNDSPKVLANLLGYRLHPDKVQPQAKMSYAQAPRINSYSRGEHLFRTRCISCHSIGNGDGIGPDLLDIPTIRDREWLVRWLKAPNKMLAEKDPIALALFAKYKEITMPNLGLNDADAHAVIDYIDEESRPAREHNSDRGKNTALAPQSMGKDEP